MFSINFTVFSFNQSSLELKNVLQPALTKHNYQLRERSCALISQTTVKSKHAEWSFGNFFAKFYNNINLNRKLYVNNDFKSYKMTIFYNFDILLNDFINAFL